MRELSLNNCKLDGRYNIQGQLGLGSYAEIYVARDTLASPQSPHSQVVIKALNVFLQNDLDIDLERTLVENFQNEAIALDRVRHPNIISRLGHGTARDLRGTVFHYLVLEYLSGGDLANLCRRERLSLKQALFFLEQTCAGLGHAHQSGIIHRDIKPQNLLLTKDHETVKIADFGVARFSHADSPITRVGTNVFAPPEHSPMISQTAGTVTVTELTPASDIYSLAKTAYILITGESPRYFANQPINELPFAFRQEDCANDLLRILNKATQNDPKERFQNVNDFWQDLAKLYKFTETSQIITQINPRNETPQPHVSRGYTPIAPQKPRFNTSRDIKLQNLPKLENPALVIRLDDYQKNNLPLNADNQKPLAQSRNGNLQSVNKEEEKISDLSGDAPKRNRSFLKRLATLAVLLMFLAGSLFITNNYLRGKGILPQFSNLFASQEALALRDINLRPDPSTKNQPVGLVSKDSRLQILNTNDNWYEVKIIEHGRPKDNENWVERGWISTKTKSGDDTVKISR
ncbi:MAG: serine/threonine protein kinase [Pyrinomonadaceae bacterium]|nr:serine/threonine protein kinase [Pyrinomonadaceae bacterium]